MAINPATTDAVTITQLDDLVLAIETFLVGSNADGKMGKFTAQQLAELLAPYVSAIGASPFVANTGSPLPNPIEKPTAITFVGIGDFDQTTGANVVTTEELNVLFWSSPDGVTGTWVIGVAIPIDLTGYISEADLTKINASQQLFDKTNFRDNSLTSGTTGLQTAGTGYQTTQDIDIPVGVTDINFSGLTTTLHRVSFYNGTTFLTPQTQLSLASGVVEIPATATKFNFTYRHSSDTTDVKETFMLGFGDSILPYQPFGEDVISEIKDEFLAAKYVVDETPTEAKNPVSKFHFDNHRLDGALTPASLGTVITGKNRFNPNDKTTGYIDPTTFVFVENPNYLCSGHIEATGEVPYTVSGLSSSHHSLGVAFYDASEVLISGLLLPADVTFRSFTTVPGTVSFKFTFKTSKAGDTDNSATIQVETGSSATSFEPAIFSVDEINGLPIIAGNSFPVTYFKQAVLFGDSITETLNINGFVRSNWPVFAAGIMQWNWANFAKSGAGFINVVSPDFPQQWLSVQIDDAEAASLTPDIVIVSLGTNDLNDALGSYTTAMGKAIGDLDMLVVIEAARANFYRLVELYPTATFYYCMPIQRFSTELASMLPLIDELRKMAHRYNFIVIETTFESGIIKDFEVSGGEGRYLYDGLHPNIEGQKLIANTYCANILRTYRNRIT